MEIDSDTLTSSLPRKKKKIHNMFDLPQGALSMLFM